MVGASGLMKPLTIAESQIKQRSNANERGMTGELGARVMPLGLLYSVLGPESRCNYCFTEPLVMNTSREHVVSLSLSLGYSVMLSHVRNIFITSIAVLAEP